MQQASNPRPRESPAVDEREACSPSGRASEARKGHREGQGRDQGEAVGPRGLEEEGGQGTAGDSPGKDSGGCSCWSPELHQISELLRRKMTLRQNSRHLIGLEKSRDHFTPH